jgi:SAM-dependent methyltransferase
MMAADLACGTGQWTRQLAAWGLNVTGYNFSPAALRQATAAGLSDGLSYVQWDVNAEPIPHRLKPGSLDLVLQWYFTIPAGQGRSFEPSGLTVPQYPVSASRSMRRARPRTIGS